MSIQINEGTQSTIYTQAVTGGTEVQVIKLDIGSGTNLADFGGSITEVGTIPNIGVIHNAGTIASIPQVSVGTIPQVSVGTLPQVSVGTIPAVSVGTLPDPLGSVVVTVGTIAALPDPMGSVVVTAGTVAVTAGTIATGSIANVAKIHDAGTVGSVISIGVVHNAGTVAGGTINVLAAGTVQTTGLVHADAWAVVASSGTSTLGTLVGSVSGSVIYVTDITISAGTATNVEIASGGTSTPILGTVHLADLGGMVSNFRTPLKTASGSALVYKQSTDGPLTITAQGYID